jgi:hypothetical protein
MTTASSFTSSHTPDIDPTNPSHFLDPELSSLTILSLTCYHARRMNSHMVLTRTKLDRAASTLQLRMASIRKTNFDGTKLPMVSPPPPNHYAWCILPVSPKSLTHFSGHFVTVSIARRDL